MKTHGIDCITHVSAIAEKMMVDHPHGGHVSFGKTNINYENKTNNKNTITITAHNKN